MQRRRVNFHTLGCKLNFSESSTLAREFEAGGFIRVGVSEAADISVINSCSVTEHADKKCRNLIRKSIGATRRRLLSSPVAMPSSNRRRSLRSKGSIWC